MTTTSAMQAPGGAGHGCRPWLLECGHEALGCSGALPGRSLLYCPECTRDVPVAAPGGSEQELRAFTPVREELRRLRALAGGPSARAIARDAREEAATAADADVITAVLDGTATCPWPVLEAITIALGGDTGQMRLAWAQWRIAAGAARGRAHG
jgi:hypothetical protein